jgi:hypothetical protein
MTNVNTNGAVPSNMSIPKNLPPDPTQNKTK